MIGHHGWKKSKIESIRTRRFPRSHVFDVLSHFLKGYLFHYKVILIFRDKFGDIMSDFINDSTPIIVWLC